MAKQSKTSAQRIIGAEKRLKALELRKCGASFAEIGKALAISTQRAHKIVMEELERLALQRLGTADELRRLESERLDMASIPVLTQLKKGSVSAAFAWIRLSESRRKLFGLDAPTKIAPTTPDGQALPGCGVLLVPASVAPEAWEEVARVTQAKLKQEGGTDA